MSSREEWVSALLAVTIIGLALYTLWKMAPRRMFDREHAWLVATLAVLVLYVIAPDRVGDGGQISQRLTLFVVMAAVMWFARFAYPRHVLAVIVVASVAVTAGLTVLHLPKYAGFNRDIDEYTSVGPDLPPGATVVALNFVQANDEVPGLTSSVWTRPIIQDTGYLVAERDIVDISQFNAGLSYFITQFRAEVDPFRFIGRGHGWLATSPGDVDLLDYEAATGGKGRIDYVLTWGEDQAPPHVRSDPTYDATRAQLAKGYELITTSARGHAKLYRRR